MPDPIPTADVEQISTDARTIHRGAAALAVRFATLEVIMSEAATESDQLRAAAQLQVEQTAVLRAKLAELTPLIAEQQELISNLQAETLEAISAKQAAEANADKLAKTSREVTELLGLDDHLDAPAQPDPETQPDPEQPTDPEAPVEDPAEPQPEPEVPADPEQPTEPTEPEQPAPDNGQGSSWSW